MGMMKDFAMEVSQHLGYEGDLNEEVLQFADDMLKLRELKRTDTVKAVIMQMSMGERMREIRRKNEKANGSGEQRIVQRDEFDSIPC